MAGAIGGTAVVTGGVAVALMSGGGEGGDGAERGGAEAKPAASVGRLEQAGEFTEVLERHGAVGCKVEKSRVECRVDDRYVAAQVIGEGLDYKSVLASWKVGAAQAMTGDRGSYAIIQGPNWLVTGPDDFVGRVQPELAGPVVYCDRPYSGCR